MNYWRTLFNRSSRPYTPQTAVIAIPATTDTKTVTVSQTGLTLGALDFSVVSNSDLLLFLENI